MHRKITRHRSRFQCLEIVGLVFFLLLGSAVAQKHSRFEEHPSERDKLAAKLSKKSADDLKNARKWARAHGKPMRFKRKGMLYELAAIENGKPLYFKTLNYNAAISTAASRVRNTVPYNLNGAGVNVGIWDGGAVLASHVEFGSRVTVKDGTATTEEHATHVAGTIGASGVNPTAQGMAPSVNLHSYKWDGDLAEMTSAAASAPNQTSKLYLSNHSYGYGRGWENGVFNSYDQFGQYNSRARQVDEIMYGHQYYLPFFAAGNDRNDGEDGTYKNGFDCMADYAIAKNVMTVGAVNDAVSGLNRSLSKATMTTFSSWGPADDGRIKPDIVANGSGLYSTLDNNSSSYGSKSGTSMSSPSACGSAALLVEYYSELFPGEAMRASTLKGLIIHTADDLGRPGPDYSYGWGLMNTLAAAKLLEQYAAGSGIKLTEASLASSHKSDTYDFQWNGVDPIRVTLCWTDPAGSQDSSSDNRGADLVHDLDLRITGPGGTYYPYKLSYSSPAANATTGENNVDNVEQVYIASPTAGAYTITVDYDGSLGGSAQWYSLLVSGESGDADIDGIPDSWESLYFGGYTNAPAHGDLDGDGADNLSEYVAGTVPTDANSVFKITAHSVSPDGGAPFVLNWSTIPGHVYSVSYSPNLQYVDFSAFPDAIDLPASRNSYTDAVERAGNTHLYRIEVKFGE